MARVAALGATQHTRTHVSPVAFAAFFHALRSALAAKGWGLRAHGRRFGGARGAWQGQQGRNGAFSPLVHSAHHRNPSRQNPPLSLPPALNLSPSGDLTEAAAALFAHLRALDARMGGAGTIAVAPLPEAGLGLAINDRLARAAAPRDLPDDR